MKNFSYSGGSLTVTATESVKSGEPYLLGSAFGVVSNSTLPGQSFELFLTGVWHLPKDSTEVKLGDKIYWDPKQKLLTANPSDNPTSCKLVGIAAESASAEKTTLLCRLNGISV